jgi:hypothetical protein
MQNNRGLSLYKKLKTCGTLWVWAVKNPHFNKPTGVNMKTLFEQYREQFSDILYCCYCLEPKGESYSCCQENHFIEFKDLDIEDQKEIIEAELDGNT